MHLFLAIDLPEAIKTKLDRQLIPLKNDYPQFNWVPKEHFHITVRYFGEMENVEKVVKKIEGALFDAPSFYLYSLAADLFIHNNIVLHTSFHREKTLEQIEASVATAFDIPKDYKYTPHLTFARSKVPSKQQYFHLKKKLEELTIDIEFPVTKLTLYQSTLTQKRPVYTTIAEFPLIAQE